MTSQLKWLTLSLARFAVVAAATLALPACGSSDDEEDEVKPIEFTVGIAVPEPATPANAAVEPAVAYDGTRVHVVYSQHDGAGLHNLMYVARVGAGAFSAPAPVFPASTADSRNAHTHLDSGGTLHIVWEEGTSPNRDIWYATINGSGSISTASNLSSTVGQDEANARVHVDGTGRVHVVWEGATPPPSPSSSIFYRRTQGSVFLSVDVLPKADGGNQPAQMPDITTDAGGRVFVIWSEQNGAARNLRMVRSDDNGANFGTPPDREFVLSGSVDMTWPRIVGGNDGQVFLCFTGQDSQGERGVFASYTSTGFSMALPGQLASSQTGGLRDPSITAYRRDNGAHTVVIAWSDGGPSGGSIVIHASHDSGRTYPKGTTNLSQGNTQPATNLRPAIALDDNELIACWQAQPQGGGVVRVWASNTSYKLP